MKGNEATKLWRRRKKMLLPQRVRRAKAVNVENYIEEKNIVMCASLDQDPAGIVIITIRRKMAQFQDAKKGA